MKKEWGADDHAREKNFVSIVSKCLQQATMIGWQQKPACLNTFITGNRFSVHESHDVVNH
jgi:hypothetical protein